MLMCPFADARVSHFFFALIMSITCRTPVRPFRSVLGHQLYIYMYDQHRGCNPSRFYMCPSLWGHIKKA